MRKINKEFNIIQNVSSINNSAIDGGGGAMLLFNVGEKI